MTIVCTYLIVMIVELLLTHIKDKVNLAHVEPVCGTFDHRDNLASNTLTILNFLIDCKAEILVVMTSKYKVDPGDLLCKLLIVLNPHVGQSNH